MRSSPRLEVLEDRVVPALFGNPWADASTLKVSFLADGTVVGSQDSGLSAKMDDNMTEAVWQGEILRAIQTWAAVANLNVRLETDSGDPVGTAGAVQNDFRFGDIRIGAINLGPGTVATATPYDPSLGTWAGDILFNTHTDFAFTLGGADATYDLYTIALHEVGHALGLAGNLTPGGASAMFDYYIGARAGLHSSDVTAIQKLYDTRDPDRFEGDLGNDTLETAARFTGAARQSYRQALRHLETAAEAQAVERLTFDADLTTASDVDWYRFKTSATNPGFTITLTTGSQSLLHARLTVFDASGAVVGQKTMTSASTEFVAVPTAAAGAVYYFRIDAAPGTAFTVGRYNLALTDVDASVAARLDGVYNDFDTEANLAEQDNDTPSTAEPMRRTSQNTGFRPVFFANGGLDATTDVDVYSLPALTNPGHLEVTLFLANVPENPGDASPVTITLLDQFGNVVATRGVVNVNGTLVVESAGALPSQAYYLVVTTTATSGLGDYRLFAQFKLPSETPTPAFSGNFATAPQQFRSVTLATTQLLDLQLTATGPIGTRLALTIFNSANVEVYSTTVNAGDTARILLLLGPGTYHFRFTGGQSDFSPTATNNVVNLAFALTMRVGNDPIGPTISDPSSPPPRDLAPAWNPTPAEIISLLQALYDPYGRTYGDYFGKWY